MYVMAKEPIPDMTAVEIKLFFANKQTEKDLADAFAITSNKFFWVEDNEYDFEVGTPEHKNACAITDEWLALMNEYEQKILAILSREGLEIPDTGRIRVLAPFMKRHGYIDGNGWWIKEK